MKKYGTLVSSLALTALGEEAPVVAPLPAERPATGLWGQVQGDHRFSRRNEEDRQDYPQKGKGGERRRRARPTLSFQRPAVSFGDPGFSILLDGDQGRCGPS